MKIMTAISCHFSSEWSMFISILYSACRYISALYSYILWLCLVLYSYQTPFIQGTPRHMNLFLLGFGINIIKGFIRNRQKLTLIFHLVTSFDNSKGEIFRMTFLSIFILLWWIYQFLFVFWLMYVSVLLFQIKCAIPVMFPSPTNPFIGVQHLWVCSNETNHGQVRREPAPRLHLPSVGSNFNRSEAFYNLVMVRWKGYQY